MGLFGNSVSHQVVVLGSSGNVGSALIQTLASKYPKLNITAGVRDPSAEKSQKLKAGNNVTLKAADLSKPDSLVAVLKGADVAFVNTPGDINRTQLAINGVKAAKDAGVKHIVVVSVLTTDNTKEIFGGQFTPIENYVKSSGLKFTLLRLPLFIDNNWAHLQSIKSQGKLYGPANIDAKLTPIAVSDIAEAAAVILHKPSKHAGKTYNLVTKAHSHRDIAAAFSKSLGKRVDYVQVPYDAAKQSFLSLGFPEWQVDGILELFQGVDRADPVYKGSSDFKKITGHHPLTIEQWTASVATAFK